MTEFDKVLKHAGVKGMKWGVIKWRKPGGKSGEPRGPGRIKQQLNSLKRERSWSKVLKEVNSLTTEQIGTVARRATLENEFKKLSKSKVATRSDKKNYRLRENMSDDKLNQTVGRLRAINSLHSQSSAATKSQREIGSRVVQTAGSLALKTYVNGKSGKKMSAGDIYESIINPKAAQTQAVKTVLDMVFVKK